MKTLNSNDILSGLVENGTIYKTDVNVISHDETDAVFEIVFYMNPMKYITIDFEIEDE